MTENVIPKIRQLKRGGDAIEHSIEIAPYKDAMDEYQSKTNDLTDILLYTLRSIKNTENNEN